VRSGGDVRVGELARDLGWSRRHLGELFAREYGVGMKELARIVRFERSVELLRVPACGSVAAVAAAVGYYDQAHLTREWRALAGCSPTQWLVAEELPSVQDGTGRQEAS
jgi:AraC-like DNA-binding protein